MDIQADNLVEILKGRQLIGQLLLKGRKIINIQQDRSTDSGLDILDS